MQYRWDDETPGTSGRDSFEPVFPQEERVRHLHSIGMGEEPPRQMPSRSPERPGRVILFAVITVVCLLGTLFLGVLLAPQLTGKLWQDWQSVAFVNGEVIRYDKAKAASFRQYGAYVDQAVIYPGVFVNGVHVGGCTIEEAGALLQEGDQAAPDFRITVTAGDRVWTVDPSRVPMKRDLGNVLEKAYAAGRSTGIAAEGETPFGLRTAAAEALRSQNLNLTTEYTYDPEDVRKITGEIRDYVTRNPVDAQIESFDYRTRTFTFTRSSSGVALDEEALFEEICAALDSGKKTASVTALLQVEEPKVTTEELQSSFCLVAAYTTKTTNDSARNKNISLAAEAVNGTALMPGETFSFNGATGERTTAKGYQSAAAIAKGQTVEETGGGVCQASSTLFNAAARANLEIVSRSPHAWPSSYVNKGEDATVDWPSLDFKFRNNTDAPVFIIMYYKNREVSAEIWGKTLGDGVKIELESKTVKTTQPSGEPNYVYNPSLPYGTSKTTVKARTGYVVETYQVWYRDGKETGRNLLHKSTYKAYQETIEYNWDNGNY